MQHRLIQSIGITWTILYAVFIIWVYGTEPRSLGEVATKAEVAAGTYQIDAQKFETGLALFRREQFRAAREEWEQADPAQRDARTQFYLAYSFYREGWGRIYNDTLLFKQGMDAVNRAISVAPDHELTVDDPDLQIHTARELKVELEEGTERKWSDLNPLKVLRARK
jgi:hypothetical protein